MKIYTDANNHVDITIDKGNKWYSYVLPKDKGLYKIESGIYNPNYYWWELSIVEKAVVKANISYSYDSNNYKDNGIVPYSTIEASFKGSNTSKVTNMDSMFYNCRGLKSLDLSGWNTSNVTSMDSMFEGCSNSLKIIMKGCSEATIGNIRAQLTTDGITGATITT